MNLWELILDQTWYRLLFNLKYARWYRHPRVMTYTSVVKGMENLQKKIRPTDTIIATFMKCGTTWTTYILHVYRCLKSGMSIDEMKNFEEICQVVPWFPLAHDVGQNIADEQIGCCRLFKSHLSPLRSLAQYPNARQVFVIRNPISACASTFTFMRSKLAFIEERKDVLDGRSEVPSYFNDVDFAYMKFLEKQKTIMSFKNKFLSTLSEYLQNILESLFFAWTGDAPSLIRKDINHFALSYFWLEGGIGLFCGNIYEYIRQAIEAKDNPNVYVLVYEQLLKDPKKEIAMLLEFMEHGKELKNGIKVEETTSTKTNAISNSTLNDSLIEDIVALTSMEEMKKIEDKFSEYWITRQQLNLGRYSPFHGPLIPSSKVGLAKKDRLSTESIEELQKYWKLKFPDYESYDAMVSTFFSN